MGIRGRIHHFEHSSITVIEISDEKKRKESDMVNRW
ncbi:Protein of unknown function [Bacillus cytotoxicus]|uniref:Uncharacterized protein n=1 Tax=Bacillus cytotoxicus TaxID=580165 RepID=A0AAX2CHC4_9BACI|nr:Protein of unknown function [Bacillus cytotoxicus]